MQNDIHYILIGPETLVIIIWVEISEKCFSNYCGPSYVPCFHEVNAQQNTEVVHCDEMPILLVIWGARNTNYSKRYKSMEIHICFKL